MTNLTNIFQVCHILLTYSNNTKIKKLDTCEEGGGTPQNFFLGFINELEKQIIIKKTVEVGQ